MIVGKKKKEQATIVGKVVAERAKSAGLSTVVFDRGGYLYRPIGSRVEGTANLYAPGRQRQFRDYFQQVWERSLPSPELRPVHI